MTDKHIFTWRTGEKTVDWDALDREARQQAYDAFYGNGTVTPQKFQGLRETYGDVEPVVMSRVDRIREWISDRLHWLAEWVW